MGGRLRTCVRLGGSAEVFLTIVAIIMAAIPAASRTRWTTSLLNTESSHAVSAATMEVTPDGVNFLDVPAGETYTQMVRLTNVSKETFQIKRIAVSSADFRITGILLPVVVAPGTSEAFTVSYRGRAEAQAAQVHIVTSTGDTRVVVQVRASAVKDQPELTASEAQLDFEDVAVGSSSQKEVVLTNSGNRALSISGLEVSGQDFSVSRSGAVSLSPGQTITVGVNFKPKAAGRSAGSLRVLGAQGGSLLDLPLRATGAPASQNVVKLNWQASPAGAAGYMIYGSRRTPAVRMCGCRPRLFRRRST
jgi:hypothetical protein